MEKSILLQSANPGLLRTINLLPGRVRFGSPVIRHNQALAKYMTVYLDHLYGVKSANINPVTASILIIYDETKTDHLLLGELIIRVVTSVSEFDQMLLKRYEDYFCALAKRDWARRKIILYGLLYLALKLKHNFFGKFSISRNLKVLQVASVVTLIGGYPLLKHLYKRFARNIPADSDILLKLTALSFTLMRESTKGVLLLILREANNFVKYSADTECLRLLSQSMTTNPGMAWVVKPGDQKILVPLEQVNSRDILCIHRGEMVPADGIVNNGKALADCFYSSGRLEAEYLEKNKQAYEGMKILSGEIQIKVSRLPDTGYKKEAPLKELLIHRRVDAYRQKITPAAITASGLSYLFTGKMMNALSVLLLLSPASASTALSSGINSTIAMLSRNGIYLRDPGRLEQIVNADHIIFDKTGTLTQGRLEIHEIIPLQEDLTVPELLKLWTASQQAPDYLIAPGSPEAARLPEATPGPKNWLPIPSQGISAAYDNHEILVGSRTLMEENRIDLAPAARWEKNLTDRQLTLVYIGRGNRLAGIIGLADPLKPQAVSLVNRLRQSGFSHVSILTGDRYNQARVVGDRLGILDIYSECTDEDKAKIVEQYMEKHTVTMVGDGINDMAAMEKAHVAISFAQGTCDRVKQHADCIIFEDSMMEIADLFILSRKAYRSIEQSIAFSQLYNLIMGTLAVFGRFDLFAAKSLNTVNALIVLLLNKRIEGYQPGKQNLRESR